MRSYFLKAKTILLIFILLLGFGLRFNNYLVWPRHGATFDEFAWTWLGINLIQKGMPVSWSPHPAYQNRQHLIYQGAAFWLVKPYLEHPPLFGLVAGSFALLNGASDMYHVTLEKIRPLAIFLGVLSIFMLFVFCRELYGDSFALLASLIYATIPTIVVGSRLVQNENFLIPFWLLSLFLIVKYFKTKKQKFRNMGIFVASLLPLAKVPWMVVPVSIVLILAFHKKWKDVFITIITTFLFFTFFIAYGVYFDKELFLKLWQLQLARYDISFAGFFSIFTSPLLIDRYYLDGWIYFGFISIFLLLQEFKKHIFVLFPFLTYFLVYLAIIPNELGHGWYRYPFYPFLAIGIALFIKEYFSKNQLLTFLFLVFVGLPLFQLTWVPSFGFSYPFFRAIIISFCIALLPIFFQLRKVKKITTMIDYLWLSSFFLLNIWSVLIYTEQ